MCVKCRCRSKTERKALWTGQIDKARQVPVWGLQNRNIVSNTSRANPSDSTTNFVKRRVMKLHSTVGDKDRPLKRTKLSFLIGACGCCFSTTANRILQRNSSRGSSVGEGRKTERTQRGEEEGGCVAE